MKNGISVRKIVHGCALLFVGFGARASFSAPPHANIACTLRTAGGLCDVVVTPADPIVGANGAISIRATTVTNTGLGAGRRVCLKAGNYPYGYLIFNNLIGSATAPIQITNCGGQFVIGNANSLDADGVPANSRGIDVNGSTYVKITGTGSTSYQYGIKLAGSSSGKQGLALANLTSDVEVEYLEITRSGFAGIMAKTEPTCTDTNPLKFRNNFVQRNTIIHDNYIHDLKGEGLYLGYSFFFGHVINCNGTNVTVYPHKLENTRVYRNRIERTGCEGIQIGCAVSGTQVYENYVEDFGRKPFSADQNNGIQIGLGSQGSWSNNFVVNTNPAFQVGHGFNIQGNSDTLVHSNTIVNAAHGFYVHQLTKGRLSVVNNTIVNPVGDTKASSKFPNGTPGRGLWLYNDEIPIDVVNNLFVLGAPKAPVTDAAAHAKQNSLYDQKMEPRPTDLANGVAGANVVQSGNIKSPASGSTTYFVDAVKRDYHLKSGTIAVDKGANVSSFALTNAMEANVTAKSVAPTTRFVGTIDIGAYERNGNAPVPSPSPSLSPSPVPNRPPVLSSLGTRGVVTGTVLTVAVSATDADGDAITITAASLPTFVKLVAVSNGKANLVVSPPLTLIPAGTTKNYSITVTAKDSKGASASQVLTLIVKR